MAGRGRGTHKGSGQGMSGHERSAGQGRPVRHPVVVSGWAAGPRPRPVLSAECVISPWIPRSGRVDTDVRIKAGATCKADPNSRTRSSLLPSGVRRGPRPTEVAERSKGGVPKQSLKLITESKSRRCVAKMNPLPITLSLSLSFALALGFSLYLLSLSARVLKFHSREND